MGNRRCGVWTTSPELLGGSIECLGEYGHLDSHKGWRVTREGLVSLEWPNDQHHAKERLPGNLRRAIDILGGVILEEKKRG